ncbi:MAG: BON domain-containing protein [Burkholderiales bacterium]|nr:BON domain-containing protein [Burkholderiales bacterium]
MNATAAHHQRASPELSDTDLAYIAQAALTWNRSLPPDAVRASAKAGWLTLAGEVQWHYQRQDAADCVRHLPGVAGIRNDITLRPAATAAAQLRAAP